MNKTLTDDLRSEAPCSSYHIEEEEEEEETFDKWEGYSPDQMARDIGLSVGYFLRDDIKNTEDGTMKKENVFLKDITDLVKLIIQSDYSNDEIKSLFYDLEEFEPDTYEKLLKIVETRHELSC